VIPHTHTTPLYIETLPQRATSSCLRCETSFHILCLARSLLECRDETEKEKSPHALLPQGGPCPACSEQMVWPIVVERRTHVPAFDVDVFLVNLSKRAEYEERVRKQEEARKKRKRLEEKERAKEAKKQQKKRIPLASRAHSQPEASSSSSSSQKPPSSELRANIRRTVSASSKRRLNNDRPDSSIDLGIEDLSSSEEEKEKRKKPSGRIGRKKSKTIVSSSQPVINLCEAQKQSEKGRSKRRAGASLRERFNRKFDLDDSDFDSDSDDLHIPALLSQPRG